MLSFYNAPGRPTSSPTVTYFGCSDVAVNGDVSTQDTDSLSARPRTAVTYLGPSLGLSLYTVTLVGSDSARSGVRQLVDKGHAYTSHR